VARELEKGGLKNMLIGTGIRETKSALFWMENSGRGMPEDYSMVIIENLVFFGEKKKLNSEDTKTFSVVLCCQLTYILILFKCNSLNSHM